MNPVREYPGLPIVRYPGSKSKVAHNLIGLMPLSWIREYREPFLGGGSIYAAVWRYYHITGIAKPAYWLNDIWQPLYRMYVELRDKPEFAEHLIQMRASVMPEFEHEEEIRQVFDECRFDFDHYGSPAALWFLLRYAFDQYVREDRRDIASFNADYMKEGVSHVPPQRIYGARTMLQDATITNVDYSELVMAPGERVFLMLDPPYWQGTKEHGSSIYSRTFTRRDHVNLFDMLAETPHRFLMTYGWCSLAERLSKERGFRMLTQRYYYSRGFQTKRPGRGMSARPKEFIIMNYDPID